MRAFFQFVALADAGASPSEPLSLFAVAILRLFGALAK